VEEVEVAEADRREEVAEEDEEEERFFPFPLWTRWEAVDEAEAERDELVFEVEFLRVEERTTEDEAVRGEEELLELLGERGTTRAERRRP
jgi:hypothetical protein